MCGNTGTESVISSECFDDVVDMVEDDGSPLCMGSRL